MMVIANLWHRPMALGLGILAGLVIASSRTPAVAGTPDSEIANVESKSRLLDSGDHIQILGVQRIDSEDKVIVLLRVDGGYHINANPASEPYLIPTTLAFNGVVPLRILYPAATRFRPKFVDESLDVYQDVVAIAAFLPKGTLAGAPALSATLTVQACTDIICLPPADVPILTHS